MNRGGGVRRKRWGRVPAEIRGRACPSHPCDASARRAHLAKAGRVVVPGGFGVAKGLQDGVGVEQLVLDLVHFVGAARDGSDVLHNLR